MSSNLGTFSDTPTQIKVSVGTAGALDLADVRQITPPTTAYLMAGTRCQRNCGFCAQARTSQAQANALSRITWPPHNLAETITHLAHAYAAGDVKRCCIQITTAGNHVARAEHVLRQIRQACGIPLSLSIQVRNVPKLEPLFEAGADRIGLALDAATPTLYRQIKGPGWQRALALLDQAASRFPQRISTHLIAGLGEQERDLARLFQRFADRQITLGLFAFTPIPGTAMAAAPPPVLASYRRVQLARFLIQEDLVHFDNLAFDDYGQIIGYGLDAQALRSLLGDGRAFQTAGCRDCNRPYYNERPGGPMYNYARPLTREEARQALSLALKRRNAELAEVGVSRDLPRTTTDLE